MEFEGRSPKGVPYDMPYVVRDAPALLEAQGVEGHVTIASGDISISVPTGAIAWPRIGSGYLFFLPSFPSGTIS